MNKKGDLRVWWIPQVPMNESFTVCVQSVEEAILLLNTLANYDLFQLKHKIKPDYSNAGGLSIFDGKEWGDWYDEEDRDIDEVMRDL